MRRLLSGVAMVLAGGLLAGQEAEPPVFTAGTEAVLLDMVVRDAEGRDGQIVSQSEAELPEPDAGGRVAYLGQLPAQAFAPGRYEVHAGEPIVPPEVLAAADVRPRYRALVERYRAGSHYEAVSELRSWEPDHVSLAVGQLLDAWREARIKTAGVIPAARAIQTASLLHADAMLAAFSDARRDEHALQLKNVRRLLRPLHAWQLAEGRGVKEAIPLRDLYLGIAAAQLGIGAILQANVLVAEYSAAELGLPASLSDRDRPLAEYSAEAFGLAPPVQPELLVAQHLRDVARDSAMLLLAGCAQEAMPNHYRVSKHDALRRAERFFRHTLDLAPESAEARLRLGWTLLRRGKRKQARAALEDVAESGDPTQVYLAWLFLGRLHEQDMAPEAAIAAFRRAIEVDPGGQAAQVGLARALERETNYRAAREVLAPFFLDQRSGAPRADPWVDYPFGPEELRLRPIDALRQRIRRP